METATVGPWTLAYDADLTRQAYEGCIGAPEQCGCPSCLHFASARQYAYPSEARRLFEMLGINRSCEAEVYESGPTEQGERRYGGWFHFIGTVEGGREATQSYAGGRFVFWFIERSSLLRPSFAGYPVVQLEFETTVPDVDGKQRRHAKHDDA
ncbi:MAG: hypothetical protein ACYC7H_11555 [Chloroflexota bacterium]